MIQQIVILEGPDGAGKTTVANELATKHKFKIFHTGPPTPSQDVFRSYATSLFEHRYHGAPVVFDRYHLGERVYGPIFRDRDAIGPMGVTLLDRIISAYGATVVVCLPPYEICVENIRRRGDTLINSKNEDKFKAVYEKYQRLSDGVYDVYDYTTGPFECPELVLPLPEGFIGSRSPQYLFIGEVANHAWLDLPFMALGGSSSFLNLNLAIAGFQESEMAFVNAYDISGNPNDLYLGWQLLGKPFIVTLGKRAAIELSRQWDGPDIRTGGESHIWSHTGQAIDHPAFWKRFHSNDPGTYMSKLKFIREKVANGRGSRWP